MSQTLTRRRLAGLAAVAAGALAVAWPAAVPAQTRTVTLAQGVDPEVLDPAYDTLITSVGVMMNIFDALIWRDAKGNLVPALAESWEFPAPTQIRMKLRGGVKWHNGDAFTADDVVFTFARIFDKGTPKPLLTSLQGLVDRVEKIDDATILVHMPRANATALPSLVRIPIVPKRALEAAGERAFGQAPVGTGPFRFVRWDKNQQIVLDRFDDHWRGKAAIDRFVIRPIPEDFARFASLRNGSVDIMANLSAERVKEIEGQRGLKWKKVHSVRNMFVGLNTKVKPFDDVRVRRALNHAVDKKALVEVVMGGHAVANTSVCTQTLFGWSAVPDFAYDVAAAKRLLAEAGYPTGFEVTMLGPVGRYTKDKEIQEAIAGMLAEIGVRVKHVQPEWAAFLQQWQREAYPMHYIGTGNQVMDCDQHLGYRIDGKRWNRYYQSDAVDALIAEQLVSHDPAARKQILARVQSMLREDAPWIFLFDLVDLYGMTSRIDWEPRPDEMIWAYDIKVTN